jgi:hypothetical protein
VGAVEVCIVTVITSEYNLDNIEDAALRSALNAVKAQLRAARSAGDAAAMLQVVRNGAAEMAVFSHDPGFSDAVACLKAVACHLEGLPPEDVVKVIAEVLEEREATVTPPARPIGIDDFFAHMPSNKFIFALTGDLWPKAVTTHPLRRRDSPYIILSASGRSDSS